MKKAIIFASIAVFGLASCKKDWDCECETTDSANPGTTLETESTINDTKKKAEEACEGQSQTVGTVTTDCHIHDH